MIPSVYSVIQLHKSNLLFVINILYIKQSFSSTDSLKNIIMIKYKVKNNKLLKRKCKQIYLLPKIEEKKRSTGIFNTTSLLAFRKGLGIQIHTPYLLITFYFYFLINYFNRNEGNLLFFIF